MKLLDALAPSPPDQRMAILVLIGVGSLHVEHSPLARQEIWRSLLAEELFCVAVVTERRPGEPESTLLERVDRAACENVRAAITHPRKEMQKTYALLSYGAGNSQSRSKAVKSIADVCQALEQWLLQQERGKAPSDLLTLLLAPSFTTDYDSLVEAVTATEADSVPEKSLPPGMAPTLVSRYEQAREQAVKEFGILRSDDLARAVHSSAGNVSLVASKWRRKREIFAVNYAGKPGYFAFQFDPMTGRPKPSIARILSAFPPDADGWRIAMWFASANTRLGNRRPVDLLDQAPEKVIKAAQGEHRSEVF